MSVSEALALDDRDGLTFLDDVVELDQDALDLACGRGRHGISIFIASTRTRSSPSLTAAPTAAGMAQIRPATSVRILISAILFPSFFLFRNAEWIIGFRDRVLAACVARDWDEGWSVG